MKLQYHNLFHTSSGGTSGLRSKCHRQEEAGKTTNIYGFGLFMAFIDKQTRHHSKIRLQVFKLTSTTLQHFFNISFHNFNYLLLFYYIILPLAIKWNIKIGPLTPSFLPSCGIRRECWVARASASSSYRQSWPCAPCDQVYGKTDQTNPVQRRERGMEDERKSSRMRGWNGCTHKEGKQWENDDREGEGGCRGGGGDDQGSCILSLLKIASLSPKPSLHGLCAAVKG